MIVEQLRAAGCVFAEDEAVLLVEAAAGDDDVLRALLGRRVAGEPLEHVVGWAEFCGLRIAVAPGVFVPRPRTEALVARALELARGIARPVVVDLCCGSGALGIALATTLSEAELHVSDIDPRACACARENVDTHLSRGSRCGAVYAGDLAEALPGELRGRVDLLLANVPYVASADIATLPREARDHEPLATLDGGVDGLDVARRVASLAPSWLAPGGHVLTEATPQQAPKLAAALESAGLVATITVDEELDATVVTGTRAD